MVGDPIPDSTPGSPFGAIKYIDDNCKYYLGHKSVSNPGLSGGELGF